MADALKRVKSEDPLRIPAATFNTLVDAAQTHGRADAAIVSGADVIFDRDMDRLPSLRVRCLDA